MSNFAGYLLASGNAIFPNEYIQYNTWKSTPSRREDQKAKRDDNTRNLVRTVASGRKSTFSFSTIDNLHLVDKQIIHDFFKSRETSDSYSTTVGGGTITGPMISLTFWNDELENYYTGYFYRPNTEFTIKRIAGTDIIYNALELEFIEY